MLKENVTNLAVGDGITLGEGVDRFLMLPPLPVPMTKAFLNVYQQRMQSPNFPDLPAFSS